MEEKPYIIKKVTKEVWKYNTKYGDTRVCECGHPYYRHFDSYEDMRTVGCKYCTCTTFKESIDLKYIVRKVINKCNSK